MCYRQRRVESCTWSIFFFFNDTATTEIYTLSLHDALPIYPEVSIRLTRGLPALRSNWIKEREDSEILTGRSSEYARGRENDLRSEEHTSELQSHLNLVCRLLLEKKHNTSSWIAVF